MEYLAREYYTVCMLFLLATLVQFILEKLVIHFRRSGSMLLLFSCYAGVSLYYIFFDPQFSFSALLLLLSLCLVSFIYFSSALIGDGSPSAVLLQALQKNKKMTFNQLVQTQNERTIEGRLAQLANSPFVHIESGRWYVTRLGKIFLFICTLVTTVHKSKEI